MSGSLTAKRALSSHARHRCRLCGSGNATPLFNAGGSRIARCRQCNFVQVVDRISALENVRIYAEPYFSHEKYKDGKTLLRENNRRLRLVQRFVKDHRARILEVGCGTGDFISLAKGRFEISGFDISAHAVTFAQQHNADVSRHIYLGDVSTLQLPRSHFDAVCLWDVIEHLWDFESGCLKLMDALKPGGLLFLSTPDIHSVVGRVLGRFWPLMTPPEHVSFFSAMTLRYFLERRLHAAIVYSSAKGKWMNMRFAVMKFIKVLPAGRLARFFNLCQKALPVNSAFYCPSQDIRYLVARKLPRSGK